MEAANVEQIRMKQRERELEEEENRRIAAYMAEKSRREKELQEEKIRIAHEKELEVALFLLLCFPFIYHLFLNSSLGCETARASGKGTGQAG